MKKHLPLFVAINVIIFTIAASNLFSQGWNKEDLNLNKNFYQIEKSFNDYWKDKDINERGKGWKVFKRWEWFWGQRVYPTGVFPNPDQTYIEYKKLQKNRKQDKTLTVGNWTNLGPNSNSGGYGGLGRINVIRESPSSSSILYAGAASGGLWKSTNSGTSWTTSTDDLSSLGVTDILFDPSNSNTMYMATGDGDHSDTYSVGVLKSTDAGASWSTTGLNWVQSNNRTISRMLINPNNNQVVYAGGSSGIYKTTNAGSSWTLVFNSMSIKDMELKPGTPSTIYAARNAIYRSTDDGATWTLLTNGLPTTGKERIALAVTPANANYVYALISSTANSGYLGLYRSTDGGDNWTLMSNTPNILGWNATGTDTGGQSWYDLALAASPSNADEIYSGGINIWRSANGGANWSRVTYWNTAYSPTVHADQHDLWFAPGSSRLYAGNDGGVYLTSNGGTNWSWISSGMEITQFYRIGGSATNAAIVIGGAQDNGTKLKGSTSWTDVIGGDGMECIIDHSNASIMYGEIYYGSIRKSTNGGSTWATMSLPSEYSSGMGAWVTPYVMHPTNSSILYAGYRNVFKSTNGGTTWTQISSFTSGILNVLNVAPSNDNYIYCSTGGTSLKATTNGGTTWTEYSLPAYTTFTYLAVHQTDPLKIWASFSGYSSGSKVYYSTNGGQSWTNISGSLPNVPVNTVIFQKDYNNRIYAGTDIGVFYRDDNTTDWVDFSTGLPNVVVNELEIQYTTSKLRAATFGRGLWEAEIPTAVLDAPVLSSPADAAANVSINPALSWNSVNNATSYTLQYSTSNSFTSNTQSVTTSLSSDISGLSYNTTYYWRVKAFDGTAYSSWSTVRSFTTEQLVLSAPVLSSPADASTGISLSPALSWGAVTNATGYTIQYSTASDFTTNTQSTSTATSQSLTGLSSLTTYYWRVKATNGGIESSWSSVYSFTTLQQTLDAPVLSSPADIATNVAINPALSWNPVTGATSYVVQYSTSSAFSTFTQSTSTTASLSVSGLSYNTTYYWRVKAYDGTIYSNWSSVYSFTTLQLTLSAPTLLSPSNNATGISANPSLSWNSVTDATGYTIQYSTTSGFSTYSQVTSSTSSVALSGLSYTTAYYWRVKATNGGIESGWSSVWGFTTQSVTLTVPTLDLPRNNSRNVPTTTDCSWYSVTNATGYDIEYSTSSIFSTSTIVSSANINATINGLNLNTTYYWRARAKANNVNGGWSSSRKFKTIMAKPGFGNGDLISNDEDLRITPNPAKDKVDFIFYLLDAGNADISLFDLKGNKVMNIANGDYNEGVNVVSRNLVNLSSGVYVVVLKSEGLTVSENITIIK